MTESKGEREIGEREGDEGEGEKWGGRGKSGPTELMEGVWD